MKRHLIAACAALFLPVPDTDLLAGMITDTVRANLASFFADEE